MDISRRRFLAAAGATGALAAMGLAGCSNSPKPADGETAENSQDTVDLSGATQVEADMVVVGSGTSGLIAATRRRKGLPRRAA